MTATLRRTKLRAMLAASESGLTVREMMGRLPQELRASDRTLRDDLYEMRGAYIADRIDNTARNTKCALWKLRT